MLYTVVLIITVFSIFFVLLGLCVLGVVYMTRSSQVQFDTCVEKTFTTNAIASVVQLLDPDRTYRAVVDHENGNHTLQQIDKQTLLIVAQWPIVNLLFQDSEHPKTGQIRIGNEYQTITVDKPYKHGPERAKENRVWYRANVDAPMESTSTLRRRRRRARQHTAVS